MKKRQPMKGILRFREREPGVARTWTLGDRCKCRKAYITTKTDHLSREWLVCASCGRGYGHYRHSTD